MSIPRCFYHNVIVRRHSSSTVSRGPLAAHPQDSRSLAGTVPVVAVVAKVEDRLAVPRCRIPHIVWKGRSVHSIKLFCTLFGTQIYHYYNNKTTFIKVKV